MGLSLLPLSSELAATVDLSWLIWRVQSGKESIVESCLKKNGADAYAPRCARRRQWSDRVKVNDGPIFPGYVFTRFDQDRRVELRETTPYVFDLIQFGHEVASISDLEIERVRRMTEEVSDLMGYPRLVVGDRVRFVRGCLEGVQGVVAKLDGALRVAVNYEMLGRAVTTPFDREMVEAA